MKTFLLSLFSGKTNNINTTKSVSPKTENIVTNPINTTISAYREPSIDYTSAELKGIESWENETKERNNELRDILKHKPNSKMEYHLNNTRDVFVLAKALKEKPDFVKKISKIHEGNTKEIVELIKLAERKSYKFEKIFSRCDLLKAEDYEKLIAEYKDFEPQINHAISEYKNLIKLRKEIEELQNNNGNPTEISMKFIDYRFMLPEHLKQNLTRETIKTTKMKDIPMMSVDDLVQKIIDIKNKKGLLDYIDKVASKPTKPYVDPLLQRK